MKQHSPHNQPVFDALGLAQPSIDVRAVLVTVAGSGLLIALEERLNDCRLPRGVPKFGESLDLAARRIVRDTTGVNEQYLEQLYTLSVPDRGRWEIIVGYIALIASHQAPTPMAGARWCEVAQLPPLVATDRLVVDYALMRLRAKLGYTNVAFHLLPEAFTLTELQNAYETILGRRLDKRNFRRRVIASGILAPTPEKRRDGSHRPAALYRFRAEHDPATYLTPPWAGET